MAAPAIPPQAQELVGKLLPYVPTLLRYASHAPAYIVGFVVAFVAFAFFVGPAALRTAWYPTAAYDLAGMALAAALLGHVGAAVATWQAGRWEQRQHDQLARDIRVKQHRDDLD